MSETPAERWPRRNGGEWLKPVSHGRRNSARAQDWYPKANGPGRALLQGFEFLPEASPYSHERWSHSNDSPTNTPQITVNSVNQCFVPSIFSFCLGNPELLIIDPLLHQVVSFCTWFRKNASAPERVMLQSNAPPPPLGPPRLFHGAPHLGQAPLLTAGPLHLQSITAGNRDTQWYSSGVEALPSQRHDGTHSAGATYVIPSTY